MNKGRNAPVRGAMRTLDGKSGGAAVAGLSTQGDLDDARAGDPPSVSASKPEAPANGALRRGRGQGSRGAKSQRTYAALDLGTNNCRLLVANATPTGFRVVDAFSRIVRLGEGVAASGALSDKAMDRAVEALKICAQKMARRNASRRRCIATQACRSAANGEAFLERVRAETGIEFEIISPEEEARLSVAGCADLIDPAVSAAIVFDIGGGSTEVSFLKRADDAPHGGRPELASWLSIPFGVVTLAERFGGANLTRQSYDGVVASMREALEGFDPPSSVAAAFRNGQGHLLGTSGTVTSLAGVHLALPKYRRDAVDGLWLSSADARRVSEALRAMSVEERAAQPCIGPDRADLVVCGCAIFEAILDLWPCERVRVADRGLREGVLAGLIEDDRRRAAKRRRAKARANRRSVPRDAG